VRRKVRRRTAISKCAKRLRNLRLKIPLTYGVPFFIIEHIIGNSNGYTPAVLCLYLILIVSFLIFRKHHIPGLIAMTVLTCGLAFALIKVGKPAWYYNTLILFPLGMWYAYLKKYIDKFVMKNNYIYMLCITVAGRGRERR